MVPVGEADDYCASCRLNLIVPNLGVPRNLVLWYRIESAKRRLLYTLFRLRLPIVDRRQDADGGLGFEFLDAGIDHPAPASHRPPPSNVVTGHRAGIITLDISEAEDSAREHMREQMNERYRTLLGHFRHEIGHYYWDRLVAGGELLAEFRRLFGDERGDYAQALASYYRDGPRAGWESSWISAYASAHPWEDWAETWAHYLHMIDTLETAHDYGFSIGGRDLAGSPHLRRALSHDDAAVSCVLLIADWVSLCVALNALNRSMGLPDAYPSHWVGRRWEARLCPYAGAVGGGGRSRNGTASGPFHGRIVRLLTAAAFRARECFLFYSQSKRGRLRKASCSPSFQRLQIMVKGVCSSSLSRCGASRLSVR